MFSKSFNQPLSVSLTLLTSSSLSAVVWTAYGRWNCLKLSIGLCCVRNVVRNLTKKQKQRKIERYVAVGWGYKTVNRLKALIFEQPCQWHCIVVVLPYVYVTFRKYGENVFCVSTYPYPSLQVLHNASPMYHSLAYFCDPPPICMPTSGQCFPITPLRYIDLSDNQRPATTTTTRRLRYFITSLLRFRLGRISRGIGWLRTLQAQRNPCRVNSWSSSRQPWCTLSEATIAVRFYV